MGLMLKQAADDPDLAETRRQNSTILLFRHAECNLPICGNALCPSGLARSMFMPTLFHPRSPLENELVGRRADQEPYFPKPDRLVALDPSVAPFRSRELETIIPLSFHAGVPVESAGFGRDTEEPLAHSLLNYSINYPGSLQVVAWHHTAVALLARNLGCPPTGAMGMCGELGDKWSNDEFRFYIEVKVTGGVFLEATLLTMDFVPPCDGRCLINGTGIYPCLGTTPPFGDR